MEKTCEERLAEFLKEECPFSEKHLEALSSLPCEEKLACLEAIRDNEVKMAVAKGKDPTTPTQ